MYLWSHMHTFFIYRKAKNLELSKNTPKNVDCYNACSSALWNKHEVKMAGYRSSPFLCFYGPGWSWGRLKGKKKTRLISSQIDWTNLVKDGQKENFVLQDQCGKSWVGKIRLKDSLHFACSRIQRYQLALCNQLGTFLYLKMFHDLSVEDRLRKFMNEVTILAIRECVLKLQGDKRISWKWKHYIC